MYSVEEHVRQWTKREKEDIDIISGWVQSEVSVLNADRIGDNTSKRGFVDYLVDPAT
jgi:hypothetical protein